MTHAVAVEQGIARITLDHPPHNILTREVLGTLRAELAELAAVAELRVLLVGAAGRHFSAGADVGEHVPPHHEALIPEFMATVAALDAFPVPVVAAVRGRCLGGAFELVQAADIVVAGESATFGQPEIALGVIAPAACVLLPERLGAGRAAQVLYTGDVLGAVDAERAGFVCQVVADDAVDAAAHTLAGRIARHSAATLRAAKHAVRGARAAARRAALERAGAFYLDEVMRLADAQEGLRAFLEKRPPVWSDR